MKPVIETHALCKSYHGRPVVDHLNLAVPEGCVYGFLGPNGAGKSTTMKMLLGLVHPTGGSVELLGHTLNEANRIALLRQTGSLIEAPSGYLHLTARENLSIVADLKDVDRKDISRVLEIVHLTKDADRKVGQYSLGMKQRLGIAMALLGSPKLLILDEPTNGLDPAGIQEMRSLIASMPQTTGATVLISSHLLGEIEQMVDQVGILNHGKLLFEGSLQQLQKHSRGGILLRVLDAPKAAAVLQQQGVKATAPADQPVGAILNLQLQKTTEPDGTVQCAVLEPKLLPTVTHYDAGKSNVRTYLFRDYTQELAKQHGVRAKHSDFSLDTVQKIAQNNISSDFLELT